MAASGRSLQIAVRGLYCDWLCYSTGGTVVLPGIAEHKSIFSIEVAWM
jgi:nickel-dependent lactate racemase